MPTPEDLKQHSLEARQARAAIRRRLEAGEPAHCFLDEPCLQDVYLRKVLLWQRRWGVEYVAKAMAHLKAYNPKCGKLTERQKAALSYMCTNPPRMWGNFESDAQ